ncbi:MAG TPA: exodeoxyribonuclease III [Methylocystis sp.]|nr:exodeoxyribonuclease III [Methylocystis sp.]
MRIASWNVNSVRLRLPALLDYLRKVEPDVLCLQELKCLDEQFPRAEIEEAGYNVHIHGQKGFNGVALLSKTPIDEASRGLPGFEDAQSRYIEGVIADAAGNAYRVASIYLPNGNPPASDKYPYKLAFMDALVAHARTLLALEERLVLAGDYNVIPAPEDVYDPQAWAGDALFLPQTRRKFRSLLNLGLTDALRATTDAASQYTFWDYQAGAWPKDRGLRIDHLLLSPQAADLLRSVTIDRDVRGGDKPSDHAPIRADFA